MSRYPTKQLMKQSARLVFNSSATTEPQSALNFGDLSGIFFTFSPKCAGALARGDDFQRPMFGRRTRLLPCSVR